ncbi:MAG: GNAT family N-acetyltransferase [Rhodocyclaceae bacterium]|jgi:RimJ/RimL family protein N-acetyltransferase|nr:GNAT family N-acetyltransferase [Rhodocyclaceae bacterium]
MHTIPVLPLSETNREALRRHFLALDKEDLRLRFEHAISEATLMQYVDSLDFEHDAVFGVFDDRLELAGVAHLGLRGEIAEFGVSVAPGHRGEGVGTALYRRAYEYCRNHRIRTLFVHCLHENAAMMHIARKAGMEIVTDANEVEAHLRVPAGDPLSFTEEMIDDRVGLFDLALKSQFLAARTFTEAFANAAETLAHPLQQEEGGEAKKDKKAA